MQAPGLIFGLDSADRKVSNVVLDFGVELTMNQFFSYIFRFWCHFGGGAM